jgi:hypothetical protein
MADAKANTLVLQTQGNAERLQGGLRLHRERLACTVTVKCPSTPMH